VVRRLLRRVALDRLEDDLSALVLRLLLGLLGHVLDEDAAVAPALVLDALEEHFLRLLGGDAGDLQQPVALLLEHAVELLFLDLDLLLAIGEPDFEVVEVLLLDRERVELAVEDVLALGESGIVFLELLARRLVLALELFLGFELLLARGELDFLGLVGRLLLSVLADLVGLLPGAGEGISAGEMGEREDAAGADRDPEDEKEHFSHRYIPLPARVQPVGTTRGPALRARRAGGDVVTRINLAGGLATTRCDLRAQHVRAKVAGHPGTRFPDGVGQNR
jgi:hypothetical protein